MWFKGWFYRPGLAEQAVKGHGRGICEMGLQLSHESAGRLDPRERVRVSPERATPGPTGLSVFADEAEMSVRDLALMMLTVSDNAATDILIDLAGLDSINATLASLGLRATVIPGTERDELDSIGQDAGFAGWDAMIRASATFTAEEDRRIQEGFLRARALGPEHAIRTTARGLHPGRPAI
jgi:beta-lactamase class A